MRPRRRYFPLIDSTPRTDQLLNRNGYCRVHACKYPLNVWNNNRIESGKCPECYPPKPPVEPEGSSK